MLLLNLNKIFITLNYFFPSLRTDNLLQYCNYDSIKYSKTRFSNLVY